MQKITSKLNSYRNFNQIKKLLLLISLLFICSSIALLYYSQIATDKITLQVGSLNSTQSSGSLANTIVKDLVLQGLDKHGEKFSIIADNAEKRDDDTVGVGSVAVNLYIDKAKVTLSANTGLLSPHARSIILSNNVLINIANSKKLTAEEVVVWYDENKIFSDKPVKLSNTFGTLEANSFEILQDSHIKFRGTVHFIGEF